MARRCIGSARYGIEPHEAPTEDFPRQPSQKDGLGRMCKMHWNQYTAGLARDAKARKAALAGPDATQVASDEAARTGPETKERARGRRPKPEPIKTLPASRRTARHPAKGTPAVEEVDVSA